MYVCLTFVCLVTYSSSYVFLTASILKGKSWIVSPEKITIEQVCSEHVYIRALENCDARYSWDTSAESAKEAAIACSTDSESRERPRFLARSSLVGALLTKSPIR